MECPASPAPADTQHPGRGSMHKPETPPETALADDGQAPPDMAAMAAELARLRQIEVRCRCIFDQSVVGILLGDIDGVIHDANPVALAMLGHDRQSLIGSNVRDLVHPDDQRQLSVSAALEAGTKGRLGQLERRYRRADGSYLPVSVTFGPLDPELGLYQAMLQDISAQKAVEAERGQALAQARAASQAKSAFLAHMSHEIRTPLNGVMGMIQLAQLANASTEVADYLDTAMESAQGLLCILSDILEVSAMHCGQIRLSEEDFDLDEAIGPVLASLGHETRLKGLAFSRCVEPDVPPRLRGDAGRLRQILYNLAANAIKYTPAGRVGLTVSALPQTGRDRARLAFAVSDTGIGIPDHRQAEVLEVFAQAEAVMTRRFGGTGLGLSIAKGLAEQMGGRLSLTSAVGVGTTVVVELPFAVPRQPEVRSYAPAPCLAGRRVLVAEDEAINRLTIRIMLEKLGCRPQLAENGQKALEALAQDSVDCVLMDMRMPELDGLSAVRAIRQGQAGEAVRQVPVVALTAHALAEDKQAAFEAGVDAYLVKPVDLAELARVLGRLLPDPPKDQPVA